MKGNAQYAAERDRILGRAGDPQHTTPGDPRARAAAYAVPCGSCPADPVLPHTLAVHHLTDAGHRTYCTISTAAGRCPCQEYAPAGEETSVEHDWGPDLICRQCELQVFDCAGPCTGRPA